MNLDSLKRQLKPVVDILSNISNPKRSMETNIVRSSTRFCEEESNNCNVGSNYYPNCYTIDDNTCGCDCLLIEITGCTDPYACNFTPDANLDDGSCAYEVDCHGECGGSGVQDCLGECDGTAVIDDCGVCDGNNQDQDCSGECFGPLVGDDHGNCCYEELIMTFYTDPDEDGLGDPTGASWTGCSGNQSAEFVVNNAGDYCEGTSAGLGVMDACGICHASANPELPGEFPDSFNSCMGCTDPTACNYVYIDSENNCIPEALFGQEGYCIDAGTCTYPENECTDCSGVCDEADECGIGCDGVCGSGHINQVY